MTTTLEQRLAQLPPKTAIPFRQLLTTGQLADDVIDTILDAGDLAGDTSKLIGFTAGYLHLRSQGVPVHDVISMAKSQKRRINLAWSPNRWQDEHQRLSRAEALARLAEENVHYDLAKYALHLPPDFPGYLIHSSRRLGMEGLRQRHCVADYHKRIQSGACAIAAVFVDKQRWTVELHPTEKPDAPLRVTQIKGRLNTLASADIRTRIHDILGIPLPKPSEAGARTAGIDYVYMENLRRIIPILIAHQITYVTVSFDGGGDDGSINDISFDPGDQNTPVKNAPVEYLATARLFDDGRWTTQLAPQQTTLSEAIEELTYDYLNETGVDWCNNDGGFGELVIDVAQNTVSLDINVRYTESNNEYSAAHDIATGAEI